MIPAGKKFMSSSVTPPSSNFYLKGFAGSAIYHTGNGATNDAAIRYNQVTDGVTLLQNFVIEGVEFHGWACDTSVANTPLMINQTKGVLIRECLFDGWEQGLGITDSQQVFLINNRVSNIAGGSNGINLHDGGNWSNPANCPLTELFVIGNDCSNAAASAIDITIGYTTPVTPTRAVIANNRCSQATHFSCISLEIGVGSGYSGGTTTPGKIQEVVIANNNLTQAGDTTGGGFCIVLEDDGTTGSSQPDKLRDITITGNVINTTGKSRGIGIQGTRIAVVGNTLNLAGQQHGIYANSNPGGSNQGTNNIIANNVIDSSGTVAGNSVIYITNQQYITVRGNRIQHESTAAGDAGITVSNSQFVRVSSNDIENAPNQGISISNTGDFTVDHNRVYNPNAQNHTAAGTGNGIYINNSTGQGGTNNFISFNYVIDDRATHLMQQGIQNNNTAGTKPHCRYNVVFGAVNRAISAPGGWTTLRGNYTDQPNTVPATGSSQAVGASPVTFTSTDPYDADYYISGGTVSLVQFTRSGGTALQVATSTNVRVTLRPGDALTITYSAAPTVVKTPIP